MIYNSARFISLLSFILLGIWFSHLSAAEHEHHFRQTKDIGVINQTQIEYWLRKRGTISEFTTQDEIRTILENYTSRASGFDTPNIVKKYSESALLKQFGMQSRAQKQAQTNVKTTENVFVIMIDFPDLQHDNNGLSHEDSQMYYPDYPASHYQDLMFSETGYTGPNGQNLMSGYQYFQAESGGTFFFTGSSYGWVTAKYNADYYGSNDPEHYDNDQNVPALIVEAVEKAVSENIIDLSDFDHKDPYDLNNNGIVDEPDGIIDHVMVFHSSVGEEAGGGVLGDDAIWSHRFYVNPTNDPDTLGHQISGSDKKVFGYTIQPIDAAIGVVVHEFGHALGLPDEYDTAKSKERQSPVGFWSVMSSGAYGGPVPGTRPTGFSSYARSELQRKYNGNWINETEVHLENLRANPLAIDLVESTNHAGLTSNQVKIKLTDPRSKPYSGQYEYYSGRGNNLHSSFHFSLDVPDFKKPILKMMAHWNIESDWDFARVLVDGEVLQGNHTVATNPLASEHDSYRDVQHYISGQSAQLEGATSKEDWVELIFDMDKYRSRHVTVTIEYITDEYANEYGLVIDDISMIIGGFLTLYNDDAESDSQAVLDGFSRSEGVIGASHNYWIQLRSHNDIDDGLALFKYDPGVLVWYSNSAFTNNRSTDHPGQGLIGVVDADQNLIGSFGTTVQIRDAAFSLYPQSDAYGDNHLDGKSVFYDRDDYSSPEKADAGIILPEHGLRIDVLTQSTDSSSATIQLSVDGF